MSSNFANMTVKDLRLLAEALNIPRIAKMRKDELIAALAAVVPSSPAPELPEPSEPPPASAVAPAPAPVHHQGTDPGLPIPDRYGRDRLVLMVQDPHHVFAYWEVTPERLEQAWREAGEGAAPVLVLFTQNGSEQRDIDLRGGNYYLAVAPKSSYRAEIALRARDGRLLVIASSATVSTPAAAPSERQDEQWMVVDESFSELLDRAELGSNGPSSLSRFSGERFRRRDLNARLVGLDWEIDVDRAGGAVQPWSSAARAAGSASAAAGIGGGPSSMAVLSSHLLAMGLSSHLMSMSSFSLGSSASLSSSARTSTTWSSGTLVRHAILGEVPAPILDNGSHRAANPDMPRGVPPAAPATAPAPAPAPAAARVGGTPTPVASAPAPAPAAPAVPEPPRPGKLSGLATIKRRR